MQRNSNTAALAVRAIRLLVSVLADDSASEADRVIIAALASNVADRIDREANDAMEPIGSCSNCRNLYFCPQTRLPELPRFSDQ